MNLLRLGVLALTTAIAPITSTASESTPPLTLAVLGFEAVGSAAPEGGAGLSALMNDVLEAIVSGESEMTLVDRSQLNQTVTEQSVNLAGVTDTSQAVKIGRVIGAQLMVTGKAFELGESRVVTAKVIGTETTLTRSVLVRGTLDEPLDAMVFEAAEKIIAVLREHGRDLVAGPAPKDEIPGLVAALRERGDLPVMAVVIPEEHIWTPGINPVVPDPAVETEIKKVLIEAGVVVRDVQDNALADWVKEFETGAGPTWPRSLEGVEWVIVGEAFSEGAGTMGQLRFASARAEINIIRRRDGRILRADRVTTRGVDLAEQVAGKTALQKAGRTLALGMLRQLTDAPATP